MERIAVLADDPRQFRETLQPLLAHQPEPGQWVVVACSPRVTNRMSKWVSRSTREHWRRKWAEKLFADVVPWLESHGSAVECVVADGSVDDFARRLGRVQVIDARRTKMSTLPQAHQQFWHVLQALPAMLAGLGAALALVVDPS